MACREYAEARKILGGSSLLNAARYFVIEAKKDAGVGTRDINDYKSRLRRLAEAFRSPILSPTNDDLQVLLHSLTFVGVAARSAFYYKTIARLRAQPSAP
jgi:hypothetical protein